MGFFVVCLFVWGFFVVVVCGVGGVVVFPSPCKLCFLDLDCLCLFIFIQLVLETFNFFK